MTESPCRAGLAGIEGYSQSHHSQDSIKKCLQVHATSNVLDGMAEVLS